MKYEKGKKFEFQSNQLLKKASGVNYTAHEVLCSASCSSAETVEGSALSLESVDNVESGDGLSLGVLSVDNGVADNVLEEGSEDSAGLLVDVRGDSLDSTSSGQSADSRLGDSEDGLSEGLVVGEALSAGLAAAHAAFAFATAAADLSSWCHCCQFLFILFVQIKGRLNTGALNLYYAVSAI